MESKMKPRDISKQTGVSERTVWSIKARAKARSGNLSTAPKCGRPPAINHRRLRDILRKRVNRNPERSIRELAKSMPFPVSEWTVRQELGKMGLRSYRGIIKHDIMPGQETRRAQRARGLLEWRQQNPDKVILWSDEKWFFTTKPFNRQNTRFLLRIRDPDNKKRIIRVRKSPTKVMVFGLMASDGKVMPPIFIPAKESINTECYLTRIMPAVRDWIRRTYQPGQAVFMQNGAPAHTSNRTQAWIQENGIDFWHKEMWPPSSPDANPLDFSFWYELSRTVGNPVPKNQTELETRIADNWTRILEPGYVTRTCQAAWNRLQRIVDASGSYIEGIPVFNPDESGDSGSDDSDN